jgi:hypothetical protein
MLITIEHCFLPEQENMIRSDPHWCRAAPLLLQRMQKLICNIEELWRSLLSRSTLQDKWSILKIEHHNGRRYGCCSSSVIKGQNEKLWISRGRSQQMVDKIASSDYKLMSVGSVAAKHSENYEEGCLRTLFPQSPSEVLTARTLAIASEVGLGKRLQNSDNTWSWRSASRIESLKLSFKLIRGWNQGRKRTQSLAVQTLRTW